MIKKKCKICGKEYRMPIENALSYFAEDTQGNLDVEEVLPENQDIVKLKELLKEK
jgi:hypothetical protein